MPCRSARAAARRYAARHSSAAASAASLPTMSTASAMPMLRSWPSVALVDGVKIGSGRRLGVAQAGGHGHAVDRALRARTPSRPSRRGSRARCTRCRACRPGAPASTGRPDGPGRREAPPRPRGSRPVSALEQVVGRQVGQLLQPRRGHGREHPPLVGDRLRHDDVEGRDAVGGHHQQTVVAGVVELADLAGREEGQGGRGHGVSSSRASVNRWTWRRVRDRSKASSSSSGARVTSGSSSRTARKLPPLLPGRPGVALDDPVGGVAAEAAAHQGEQDRLAEHQAVAALGQRGERPLGVQRRGPRPGRSPSAACRG